MRQPSSVGAVEGIPEPGALKLTRASTRYQGLVAALSPTYQVRPGAGS